MGKHLNAAFINAMATVEICQQRILCLQYVIRGIRHMYSKKTEEDYQSLFAELYRNLNNAYEMVMMFAHVTRKEEHIREARKIAYKNFLKEGISIMQFLQLDFDLPNAYQCKLEDEFRKEIEEEFKAENSLSKL